MPFFRSFSSSCLDKGWENEETKVENDELLLPLLLQAAVPTDKELC